MGNSTTAIREVKSSFFLKLFGIIQSTPSLKYGFFKAMYNLVSRASAGKSDMVFMNYGYAGDGLDAQIVLDAADEPDRYSIQLYEFLLKGMDFAGKTVVEVGCGRGGGVSYIARYKKPQKVTGLDLCDAQVRLCRETHLSDNVEFVQASALALPFGDNSLDVVINVESSHCYPDLNTFYSEVMRVLKPGGVFLYTDFIPIGSSEAKPNESKGIEEKLVGVGFELERVADITANVVAALERTDATKRKMFGAEISSGLLSRTVRDLLATTDSKSFALFKDRSSIYFSMIARKPHG